MSGPANALNVSAPGFTLFDGVSAFFAPNKVISLIDDFFANNLSEGELAWNSGGIPISGTATNPGLLRIDNAPNGSWLILTDPSLSPNFAVGGGAVFENFVFNIGSLSTAVDRYTTYIGLMDTGVQVITTPPSNGIYFQYSDNVNSGKWQLVCNNGVTSTTINTSVSASVGFHNYGIIVNSQGNSVSFTIDGVPVGTAISTNIPSQSITPAISSVTSAGSIPVQTVDLFYMTIALTTAR